MRKVSQSILRNNGAGLGMTRAGLAGGGPFAADEGALAAACAFPAGGFGFPLLMFNFAPSVLKANGY